MVNFNKNQKQKPKTSDRFIVTFKGTKIDNNILIKTKRPSYTFGSGWNDISFEITSDIVSPSTSKAVFDGIIMKKAQDREIEIKLFDATGEEIEKWELTGDFLSVNFGDLDYSKNDLIKINMLFKIRSCSLVTENSLNNNGK